MASITYPGYVTAAISVPTRISYRPDKLLRDRPTYVCIRRIHTWVQYTHISY